jgi:hypothetical protein
LFLKILESKKKTWNSRQRSYHPFRKRGLTSSHWHFFISHFFFSGLRRGRWEQRFNCRFYDEPNFFRTPTYIEAKNFTAEKERIKKERILKRANLKKELIFKKSEK